MSDHDAHNRLRRAVEESARDNDDERGHQRNAGIAILMLAVVVVALLIAIVQGGFPGM
jgi:hypothetical protein